MKIGVRAHDYGKLNAGELAAALHKEGYQAAQLALPKAIAGIDSYDDITLKKVDEIRKAFEEEQVELAVFGCYMDLGNPDSQVREHAVATLKKSLNWAKELGAWVVGTETSYSHLSDEEKKEWKPYMYDSIMRVMEEAVRIDMRLALEPVWWHPLEDSETTLEVVKRVNDPKHLRLIFDASNLLKDPTGTKQHEYWTGWLDAIGSHVDVMHIKDFSLGQSGEYEHELLGNGVIQYEAIRQWLKKQNREIYLLREEMKPAFAGQDINFIRNLYC